MMMAIPVLSTTWLPRAKPPWWVLPKLTFPNTKPGTTKKTMMDKAPKARLSLLPIFRPLHSTEAQAQVGFAAIITLTLI